MRTRTRRALLTDLPVAAFLLAGFFTVGAGTFGHVAVGLMFVAVIGVHLLTRPALRAGRIGMVTWATIVVATVLNVSGAIQLAGVAAMIPVHSTSTYVLFVLAGVHIWQHRRVLVARLRGAPARQTR